MRERRSFKCAGVGQTSGRWDRKRKKNEGKKGIKDGNEKTESEKGGKINFHTVICHDVS